MVRDGRLNKCTVPPESSSISTLGGIRGSQKSARTARSGREQASSSSASFLPWYTAEYKGVSGIGGASVDANAWGDLGFLWGSLWALLFLAGIALLVLPAFGVAVPKLPAVAYMAVAGLATVFTLLKLLIRDDDAPEFGITVDASLGLYLAIVGRRSCVRRLHDVQGVRWRAQRPQDMNKLKVSSVATPVAALPPPPPASGMSPPPPPPPMG
jgi:hypothetical protein